MEQLVGLTDAKGRSIYEGDILNIDNGEEICAVQWCEEYAKFGCIIYLQHGEEPENDAWIWFDDNLSGTIVVGNIHQNSELLK